MEQPLTTTDSTELIGLLELMMDLLRRFATLDNQSVDTGLEDALATIGRFAGVDRSYLFQLDAAGEWLRNTHEWCAPGIVPEKDNLQRVPFANIRFWQEALQRGDSIYIPRVSELPDSRAFERDLLLQQEVQSLLVVPLVDPQRLRGFLGFDAVRGERTWSQAATLLLRAVADVFTGAIMRREAYQSVLASERRYRALARHSSDAVMVLDDNFRLTELSPSVERVLGWTPAAWRGRRFFAACHPEDIDQVAAALSAAGREPGNACRVPDHRLLHAQNDWIWVLSTVTDLRVDPAVGGIVINAHDITQRKAAEQALQHQALHDVMTGLPNRALLMDRLDQSLARAKRSGCLLGIVFIDLDHFKLINDAMGHQAGDQVLVDVARRLLDILRAGDTVARFGGDEFVLVLEDAAAQPELLVQAAERILRVFDRAFMLNGLEQRITASAGLVIADGEADPNALLRDADAAMYLAKERGRACLQRFDASLRTHLLGRLEMIADLRHAEECDAFRLDYQPLLEPCTGRLRGCEALLRWQHPQRGLVMPDQFIPLAEETGLIIPIGFWVLNQALRQASAWQARAPAAAAELFVAVNLSVHQLTSPDLVERIAMLIEHWNLPPHTLCLELTESALMHDPDHCVTVLTQLRELGLSLAIDDFGTGYSSLAYLRDLPVSKLKIDRRFVADMHKDRDGRNIVAAIHTLAHEFGMQTVAEGVENADQLHALCQLGCDLVQGYHLARPGPPSVIDAWL